MKLDDNGSASMSRIFSCRRETWEVCGNSSSHSSCVASVRTFHGPSENPRSPCVPASSRRSGCPTLLPLSRKIGWRGSFEATSCELQRGTTSSNCCPLNFCLPSHSLSDLLAQPPTVTSLLKIMFAARACENIAINALFQNTAGIPMRKLHKCCETYAPHWYSNKIGQHEPCEPSPVTWSSDEAGRQWNSKH